MEAEGEVPGDAEKDTDDVAVAVKDCVAAAEKVSVGFAEALYVGCDVHEEEGFTVMVALCGAERDNAANGRRGVHPGQPRGRR